MHPNRNPSSKLPRNASGAVDTPVDLLLTDREAAALLRIGVSTFHRYVTNGLVSQPLKLGRTSRWPQSEIFSTIETAKAQRATVTSVKEGV